MDRAARITTGLNLATMVGAEIGPLNKPLVRKSAGKVFYLDHTDTASLRLKYANDPNVEVEDIVDVDIVWGQQSLTEAFGPDVKLDYIVASHVIEHVPDMIGWLEELRSVLRPGGRVNLAVPDRRFTFDYLRQETQLADLLTAYLSRAKRPQVREILDFVLHVTKLDLAEAWENRIQPADLKPLHSFDQAVELARVSMHDGQYHDVHCWVFTPVNFASLFKRLAEAGVVRFACDGFFDTERYSLEFFVSLQESSDGAAIVESWDKMLRTLATASPGPDHVPSPRIGELERRLAVESNHCDNLRKTLDAIEKSTSWRITAPMRTIGRILKRI